MKKRNNKTKQSNASPVSSLYEMLQYKRPAGSKTLHEFIARYIAPLGATPDDANNWIVRVGSHSRVLWSSHTDSVHTSSGYQRIVISGDKIKLAYGEKANCLGADCATGVWLMREMILAGVQGLYVFHDSEESGGIGSSYIANKTPHILDGIDYAIAFDRRGADSIITHQGGSRCASNEFAGSIAPLLPKQYKADSGGVFTDTANYTHLIPECTNLGVGYLDQHCASETQSIKAALAMRESMLRFDESKLIAARDPADCENDYWQSYCESSRYYDADRWFERDGLDQFVRQNPDIVTDYLDSCGITVDAIRRWYS